MTFDSVFSSGRITNNFTFTFTISIVIYPLTADAGGQHEHDHERSRVRQVVSLLALAAPAEQLRANCERQLLQAVQGYRARQDYHTVHWV